MQSWTADIRTPWCFSFSNDAAEPMKFSTKSGTFLTILTEHKAAYKVARASNQQDFPRISKANQK
jgi:hypothetical protein